MNELTSTIIWLIIGVSIFGLMIWGKYAASHMSEEEKQKLASIQKQANEKYYNKFHTPEGQICCPACHSAQIQMLSRRWNPISGFFTGKIDRVCINCKHKF